MSDMKYNEKYIDMSTMKERKKYEKLIPRVGGMDQERG